MPTTETTPQTTPAVTISTPPPNELTATAAKLKEQNDEKTSLEKGAVHIANEGTPVIPKNNKKPEPDDEPENRESLRDIFARHLKKHPGAKGNLTNGINNHDRNGVMGVSSSSRQYTFVACLTTFPDNNTINCGKGWGTAHLESMVDAAKEKGWKAVVITEETSKYARKELLEICKRKNIPVVDKSVTATLDSGDTQPLTIKPNR
jgi:hypothetical protein